MKRLYATSRLHAVAPETPYSEQIAEDSHSDASRGRAFLPLKVNHASKPLNAGLAFQRRFHGRSS